LRAVHLANFRVTYSCDFLNPWIKKDLEGFDEVHIDDYLEIPLGAMLATRESSEAV